MGETIPFIDPSRGAIRSYRPFRAFIGYHPTKPKRADKIIGVKRGEGREVPPFTIAYL